jgi:hypothetical protein
MKMRAKLTITIATSLMIVVMLACQAKTEMATTLNANSTNVISNTVEKAGSESTTATAADPEPIVLEFYQFYLKELVANKKHSPEVMKRYLTARMLKEIKDTTDEDVVIRGSDYDDTWAKNVIIKGKETVNATKSVITVELKGKDFSKTLKVTVVAQAKTWKIDSVKDTSSVESTDEAADSSKVKTAIVKFAAGKKVKDFADTISPGERHIYVVNVRKGQYLGAQTYSETDDDVPFTVRKKGGADLEVPEGSVKWGGEAPESGDYEIVISGLKKSTKYSINISAE